MGSPVPAVRARLLLPGAVMGLDPAVLLALVVIVVLAAGCGDDRRYPGRADVRAGDPPEILIEPTGATETSPALLRVPPGTEVTWRNRTSRTVSIRFEQPIDRVCADPQRFSRTEDGQSFGSDFLLPFEEARLCFATPGRYGFVVSVHGIGSEGLPPARRGAVLVEP